MGNGKANRVFKGRQKAQGLCCGFAERIRN